MIKPSKLRADIYNLLDQVIETGVPIEIHRKGKVLKISLDKKRSKLANLKKHNSMVDDPMDYVHIDWSGEWEYRDK